MLEYHISEWSLPKAKMLGFPTPEPEENGYWKQKILLEGENKYCKKNLRRSKRRTVKSKMGL
jgi:hypothetical protein